MDETEENVAAICYSKEMTSRNQPTVKHVRTVNKYRPGRVRSCLFTSGVILFLLFFVNSFIAWNIHSTVPGFKHPTNLTWNMSRIFTTLKQATVNFVNKRTNKLITGTSKSNTLSVRGTNCTEEYKRSHLMTASTPGRTGNNLFQLANLIAVAHSTCYTAVLPPGFNINLDSIFDIHNIERKTLPIKATKLLGEPGWSIFMENITSYIQPNYNWTLTGYRQSYRYFQSHSELIRSSFQFKDKIKHGVCEYLHNRTRVYKGVSVCMHVRKGDIALNRLDSGIQFINRAITFYQKQLAPNNFSVLIASDDIDWCKKNIKGGNITLYFSPFKDAGSDLFLLTQCNHNIMTVGSFGWFGAWLNETGMVVYDKHFSDRQSGHKASDYYPRHWIGI